VITATSKKQNDAISRNAPAAIGFSMPAEWDLHEATWLGWPQNASDWPGKLDTIRWVYCEMIRRLASGETVRVLVHSNAEEARARAYLARAGAPAKGVTFLVQPTNRGWMRDSGPIFVRRIRGRTHETAIVHLHFNAWARYSNWRKDRRVPEFAASVLKKRLFHAQLDGRPFVLEGGGIDVNGCGTLITTDECYLDRAVQVRNPDVSREQFEAVVGRYLGATNVFWLGRGIAGDDTHGHVDDLCRFVNRNTLVLIREDNPRDINYGALAENWERIQDLKLEDGSRPEVVALPMPGPLFYDGDRLPASYANFYVSNAAVLVPTFNDPNDRIALGVLGELFTDRPVIGIHAVDLVLGFGTLHCLTQQQPASPPKREK
jgi:agmatine deiminase